MGLIKDIKDIEPINFKKSFLKDYDIVLFKDQSLSPCIYIKDNVKLLTILYPDYNSHPCAYFFDLERYPYSTWARAFMPEDVFNDDLSYVVPGKFDKYDIVKIYRCQKANINPIIKLLFSDVDLSDLYKSNDYKLIWERN